MESDTEVGNMVLKNSPTVKSPAWEPENWRVCFENMRTMRTKKNAPVDLMGCSKCVDQTESPQVQRYQVLVSLMLSSQTRDEITFGAMQRLRKHGLNIDNILNTSTPELVSILKDVGFRNKKATYLKRTSEILKKDFGSDIPRSLEDLCKLPGIGPKMGYLCLQVAWNDTQGIAIDTHVHRLANRLGWVRQPTKRPEKTREELESWVPKELWKDLNVLLVGFGQQVCKPRAPNCDKCLNISICPFYAAQSSSVAGN